MSAECQPREFAGRLGEPLSPGQLVHVRGNLGTSLSTWPSAETWIQRAYKWDSSACKAGAGLFRISTYAQGAIRPRGTTGPLTQSQLEAGPAALPAGNVPVYRAAPLWGSLGIRRSGNRQYLFDWGQTLIVHAESIGIGYWSPPGFAEINQAFVYSDEAVNIELLMLADIARVEEADAGSGVLALTQTYYQAAGENLLTVPVPAGAVRLQISRDRAGAVLNTWWNTAFGTVAGVRRTNTSIAIADGQSELTSIAPHVTHLQSPQLDEEALWTFAWGIEP